MHWEPTTISYPCQDKSYDFVPNAEEASGGLARLGLLLLLFELVLLGPAGVAVVLVRGLEFDITTWTLAGDGLSHAVTIAF